MQISAIVFLCIALVYANLWLTGKHKKKYNGNFRKVVKIINLTSLFLTFALAMLWSFNWHLCDLTIEIIPFWAFIYSSMILFALTVTQKLERIFYGMIFFLQLIFTVILIVPFLGYGVTSVVYSPFLTDPILYQDNKVIVTDETQGLMAAKPSPTVYIKCGLFAKKFTTDLSPIYTVDSISLGKMGKYQIEVEIHGDKVDNGNPSKLILDCRCH